MTKKWKIINGILLVIAIFVSYYYYFPINICKKIINNKITHIEIQDNNNNKTFKIKDKNDIDYIVSNLNDRIYKKNGLSLGKNSNGIVLKFQNEEQNIDNIKLYSETTIIKNPFLYYSKLDIDNYLYSYILNIENQFDIFRDYSFLYIEELRYKENKSTYSVDDLNQINDFLKYLRNQNYEIVEENIDLSNFKQIIIKTNKQFQILQFKDNFIYFNKKLYKFENNIENDLINIIKEDNINKENSLFDLQMRLNIATSNKLNFIIYNPNLNECFFESSDYIIEKYYEENNSWVECPIISNNLYQTFVRFKEDKISYIWEFDKKYGNLDEGIYRLNFVISNIEKTNNEKEFIYFKL